MRHRGRALPTLVVLSALAAFSAIGCSYQGPSQADFAKVESDPTLTDQQKEQKVDEMSSEVNFYAPNYLVLGALFMLAIGLVGARQMYLRKSDAIPPTGRKVPVAPTSEARAAMPTPPRSIAAVGDPLSKPLQTEPEPELPKMPQNQAEVDALSFDYRGTSFFTGRPAPAKLLTHADIATGIWEHTVVCTEDEARQCANGKLPLIRAFTVGERTAPWYAWMDFNPYEHYFAAIDGDWFVDGRRAIACWMSLDQCDPELKGYYSDSNA